MSKLLLLRYKNLVLFVVISEVFIWIGSWFRIIMMSVWSLLIIIIIYFYYYYLCLKRNPFKSSRASRILPVMVRKLPFNSTQKFTGSRLLYYCHFLAPHLLWKTFRHIKLIEAGGHDQNVQLCVVILANHNRSA